MLPKQGRHPLYPGKREFYWLPALIILAIFGGKPHRCSLKLWAKMRASKSSRLKIHRFWIHLPYSVTI